jgi:hypothetical protein
MRNAEISQSLWLPVQDYVDPRKVREIAATFDPECTPRGLVLPYGYHYIGLDGTHRAAALYLRGQPASVRVIESDADFLLREANRGAVLEFRLRSVRDAVGLYQREFARVCRDAGIESFYDLMNKCGLA